MFTLLAAVATAASGWTLFAEGAMLGATAYAIGKGLSKTSGRTKK